MGADSRAVGASDCIHKFVVGSLLLIGRIGAFAVVPAPKATGSFDAVPLLAASLVGLTISGWFNGGPKCVCVQLLAVCCLWALPAT